MNINLSPTFEDYIQSQLETGTYNNASDITPLWLRTSKRDARENNNTM